MRANFPTAQRVYESASPFGYLEVYSSSYLHFAPGLSDNAAFNLPTMPENAYLGMYIDGEGPSGIIRDLPAEETVYYRFLPMVYPYLIKAAPDTFVVQFGGGISTSVALHSNSKSVTVAEGNPAVLRPSAPTRACAISPATSSTIRRSASSTTTAGSISPTPTIATTSSISASPIRPACRTPAASPSSRSSPIRAKRCPATCARSRTAACFRSRCGTRKSRRNRC